ncbi:MAG TPA: alanine/ornithine racemase family PLP-dependent enzyme [Denitromonas sp.]|uniref:alanine/ornithine racemase family PLP-dependent enzyme n=1 Tax=Denitromonas sp. TaxID=2734609 RepID=UPI001D30D0D1|nr:alanine/ornithine racemase family PLP-dependent enzyme [Rhodocyclaceae bacterium]MCP5223005.1 alanine/ornithine racemase family PLP-dependent enzyme [Zoogloeaceae bacterium]HQU87541.1 alanine/ornithine racemase family PLP-dependent enzyme [Denitromonas sp.]HQV13787.1 alanine/ornithine racemase family PLP-dependent enzyme [Denitromonas sp.]
MSAPRLEIDLDKIRHNALTLVQRLARHGISVTGVTKSALGSPEVAGAMLDGGVSGLGDSRIENIEAMRAAFVRGPMTLIRTPMLSQVKRVVAGANVSFNTEIDVIDALSSAAGKAGVIHGVVLMVELGDLREGILPGDLAHMVRQVLRLPNILLKGIGGNLACASGVVPDARNMAELSALADAIDASFGLLLQTISGGNSASLDWALSGADTGRINDLRLGEAIVLGREPLHRQPIEGLHSDAAVLVAEVIESKRKPSEPWGDIAQTAFGGKPREPDRGPMTRLLLAVGHQDTDPSGLVPPVGFELLGASSDHLIVRSDRAEIAVGDEIRFQPNYAALLRAMTSPFVAKCLTSRARTMAQVRIAH